MAYSFFVLALTVLIPFESISANPLPIPYKNKGLLWYPTGNGKVVPALLQGGPPLIAADEDKVHFLLFTLENQDDAVEVFIDDKDGLVADGYVPGAPLYLISHGFSSSSSGGPTPKFKAAMFAGNKNVNIISIDWKDLAGAPWYDRAAAATKVVGEKTGRLVNFLVAEGLATLDKIHFAGHSLGAHAGGYLGSFLGAGKLGRITALDPALPLFGEKSDDDRIDPTDAAFVDVIHTAGGSLLEGGLAFKDPCGHADFYPNGGSHQPGCGIDMVCNHRRGYNFLAESINNPSGFFSCKCESWEEFQKGQCLCEQSSNMGLYTESNARGNFYLITNPEEPFSQS